MDHHTGEKIIIANSGKGITIFKGITSMPRELLDIPWKRITKISYKKNKFIIKFMEDEVKCILLTVMWENECVSDIKTEKLKVVPSISVAGTVQSISTSVITLQTVLFDLAWKTNYQATILYQ